MFGFNWVDLIIVLILINAIYNGIKIGFVALLFGFGGFFVAIFATGWILPRFISITGHTLFLIINANLVLLVGVLAGIKAFKYGEKFHLGLKGRGKLSLIESIAGLSLSLSSALIIIWLLAAGISSMPFAGLSNTVNSSYIIQKLNYVLPAAPSVFEDLTRPINPNAPIKLYAKLEPGSSIGIAPESKLIPDALKQATQSVVRITSFGCSGVVDGSGFVVGKGIVATNAHVIAGIKRPIIKSGTQSYSGEPIFFDPSQDIALLKVSGLDTKALPFGSFSLGSIVYAEGYPNSIFTITVGTIIQSSLIDGPNIYGLGNIARPTYTLNLKIEPGSSGGPLLNYDGSVVGVIYARDTKNSSIAYALSTSELIHDIAGIRSNSHRVGTGSCYD